MEILTTNGQKMVKICSFRWFWLQLLLDYNWLEPHPQKTELKWQPHYRLRHWLIPESHNSLPRQHFRPSFLLQRAKSQQLPPSINLRKIQIQRPTPAPTPKPMIHPLPVNNHTSKTYPYHYLRCYLRSNWHTGQVPFLVSQFLMQGEWKEWKHIKNVYSSFYYTSHRHIVQLLVFPLCFELGSKFSYCELNPLSSS